MGRQMHMIAFQVNRIKVTVTKIGYMLVDQSLEKLKSVFFFILQHVLICTISYQLRDWILIRTDGVYYVLNSLNPVMSL